MEHEILNTDPISSLSWCTVVLLNSACVFPGRDASLAFITGDFSDQGLTDDVSSLSPLQVVSLFDWLAFYQRHYVSVGG